jgi:tetratricopeptide (TPR) repeat protein
MKKTQVDIDQNKKIVRLRQDAGFFYERAVRSLDRHRYDKAVKYFRLAMEKEPDNPVNHCNLAGLLSELGRYEESNRVLEKVLSEVDPQLYECLFYMANNAANMGDLEMAEDYLLEYLRLDPDGEYAEEAEDMLQMVAYELGRPPREPMPDLPPHVQKHEEARRHLEEGRFLQAIGKLEELITEKPDFLAARNNLALAYYYTGRMKEALSCISQVLEADPNNLHALCNLAVLAHHMGEEKISRHIVATLKKLVPLYPEHVYKLATTLGILSEHEVAYQLFSRLLKWDPDPEPALYHYAAAAAWNTGRYEEARRFWKKAANADPESDVPRFYLNHVDEWLKKEEGFVPFIHYHYHLPFEEQVVRVDPLKPQTSQLEQLKSSPLLRSSFFWALHHGDSNTKLQVLQLMGWIGDSEAEQILRQFLLKPDEDEELKRAALLILRQMGAEPPFSVTVGGKTGEAEGNSSVDPEWKKVLELCLAGMKNSDPFLRSSVQVLWAEWVRREDVPPARGVEAWAAAIEYAAAKWSDSPLTQKEVADKYGVSVSSVARRAKMLASLAERMFAKKEEENE